MSATSAENLAASFFGGTRPTDPARAAAAARGEMAAAVDAAVAAKNAVVIIRSRIESAQQSVAFALDKVKKACQAVIAAEKISDLLGSAIAGRAQYLESIGQLSWLLRSHAIDDLGVRQFVSEAQHAPVNVARECYSRRHCLRDGDERLVEIRCRVR